MKKALYSLFVFTLPVITYAQPKSVGDINTLIQSWVTYLISLFWIAAFLSGLYSAWKFLAAKGDPKAADQAKKILVYTVIAACVALLSTVVKEIALSILGGA